MAEPKAKTANKLNDKLMKTRGTGGFFPRRFFEGCDFDEEGVPILDEFDLTKTPLDGTIVNFGSRRTGKSTLTRHLCYHYLQEFFPRAVVFSNTEQLNHQYSHFIPERYIHQGIDDEVLQNVLDFQTLIQKDPEFEERLAEDENFHRIMVVLDDVLNGDTLRYSKPTGTIFTDGRHYKACLVLSTQYPKAINPTMRDNIDLSFMFAQSTTDSLDHLHRMCGGHTTTPLFYAMLDKYTDDHMALVYYNGDKCEKRLKKKYFWIKADKTTPDFRIGTPAFWDEEVGEEEETEFEHVAGTNVDLLDPRNRP